jgi:hypothetical protein
MLLVLFVYGCSELVSDEDRLQDSRRAEELRIIKENNLPADTKFEYGDPSSGVVGEPANITPELRKAMANFKAGRCLTNCSYNLSACTGLTSFTTLPGGGSTVWAVPNTGVNGFNGGFIAYNFSITKGISSTNPATAFYQINMITFTRVGGGGSLNLRKAFSVSLAGNQNDYTIRRNRWEREVVAKIVNQFIIPDHCCPIKI